LGKLLNDRGQAFALCRFLFSLGALMCLAEKEEKTAKIKNPARKTRRVQEALAYITQKDISAAQEKRNYADDKLGYDCKAHSGWHGLGVLYG
jgi:Tfp pilus assembly protein PilF